MSQNSLVIADGTGAQVLASVNNALDTLKTCFSGPTAPGTPSPYQFWADTTTGLLKMRDAANTVWVPIAAMSGIGANVVKTVTGGSYTLTEAEGLAASFEFNGALTSNMVVIVPNNMPVFAVENLTTGAFSLTVKTAGGTGVVVSQNMIALLYCNGTNCELVTHAQFTQMLSAANQVLTSTALTKVVLGSAFANVGGNTADTTNNRVTVNVAGWYNVRAIISGVTTAAAQTLAAQIYKTAVAVTPVTAVGNPAAAATNLTASVEALVWANANDYFEIYAAGSVANGVTLQSARCSLFVERVS